MNLEEAKAKLTDIKRSTGTKNPKTLICELCVVINFLLNEIDRIKTPPLSVLKILPDDIQTIRQLGIQLPWPDQAKLPSKNRSGNAGDAE